MTPTPKKKNPQDATLRNIRALKKQAAYERQYARRSTLSILNLLKRVKALEKRTK